MPKTADDVPRLELLVPAGTTPRYTILLQSGIFVENEPKTTIGECLCSLPGFTCRYIGERIETIFYNGFPVDDLELEIDGSSSVVAVSAAMPGLAGAIFRKKSFYAPLRTSASTTSSDRERSGEKVKILLKLFNMIAVERGGDILQNGCLLKSNTVLKFLAHRPQLFSDVVCKSCDDYPFAFEDLAYSFHGSETVFLRIHEDD